MTWFAGFLIAWSAAYAAGLDVQLKDLRGSYFFVAGAKEAGAGKGCSKLTSNEIKKYGRLTHCDPEEDHVLCKIKTGERLYAYEAAAACETAFKKGQSPNS